MARTGSKGLAQLLGALLLAGPASAQEGSVATSQTAEAETRGSGPFSAVMEADPQLPNHVVYRPADLQKAGKLGVVVWGNGACADDGASARKHLGEIASHGYLVIAPGRILSGPKAVAKPAPRGPPPDGKQPPPATTTADVKAGLDWALAENGRAGSSYAGRIDEKAVAVAGHSCGGIQATELAADPRVRTVMIHNSGIYNGGVQRITGVQVHKDMLRNFRTPVVYILGGETDIAYPNGTDDFHRVDHVPIALLNLPVGHGGTFDKPGGGAVAQVSVDWLQWQLRADQSAARTFVGENCRLCSGSQWSIERKGM
jgi:dienelactone hydrolase